MSTVVLPEKKVCLTERNIVIQPLPGENAATLFQQVCADFPEHRVEQDAKGNILLMPPAGGESSWASGESYFQLTIWAKKDGRGKTFDSSLGIKLPSGATRSPDACWITFERLSKLSRKERKEFLALIPEFVIEIRSPSDRITDLKNKMNEYLAAGVTLGWLIDPDTETVYVYDSRGTTVIRDSKQVEGSGPVQGFVLDLESIWLGL